MTDDPWDHPDWVTAAVEFRRGRPPVDPRIKGKFEEMCEIADALQAAKPPPPAPPKEAPQATVDALIHQLCEGGMAALQEASVRRRLTQLSERQLTDIGGRLLWRQGGNIVRSWRQWKTKEVHKLLKEWAVLHE